MFCWHGSTTHDEDGGQEQNSHLILLLVAKILNRVCEKRDQVEKFINTWHSSQDHLKTGDFNKKRENGSFSLKPEPPVQNGKVGTFELRGSFETVLVL